MKLFIIVIGIMLVCCNTNKKSQVQKKSMLDSVLIQKKKEVHKMIVSTNFFSSSLKKDTFILELKGKFLTKARVDFRIITSLNEVIFNEQFEMMDLYGWGPDVTKPNPDSVAIEKHLLERFENFFDSKYFYRPAIKKDEKYDELLNGVISKEEWEEIRDSVDAVGFGFTLGEESISYIVYSRENGKAILYKTCC